LLHIGCFDNTAPWIRTTTNHFVNELTECDFVEVNHIAFVLIIICLSIHHRLSDVINLVLYELDQVSNCEIRSKYLFEIYIECHKEILDIHRSAVLTIGVTGDEYFLELFDSHISDQIENSVGECPLSWVLS